MIYAFVCVLYRVDICVEMEVGCGAGWGGFSEVVFLI